MSPFERHSTATTESLQALWGVALDLDEPEDALLSVPDGDGGLAIVALTYEEFYELHEAVNALYAHIRQENSN